MTILARILLIAGFCIGTLGAAGFAKEREPEAVPLFGLGTALLAVGGFMVRGARKGTGGQLDVVHGERERYRRELSTIRDAVRELTNESASMPPLAVRDAIDALVQGDLFDLTSAHEDIAALLGFQAYSRIWEGVASGERLLNRSWSMLTDGATEEGLAELPLACVKFDAAVEAFEHN